MFLFGILSSPLPYLLMAVFYFFGFATGMFQKEAADKDKNLQVQVNTIQVEPASSVSANKENNFQFHQYKFEKKVVAQTVQSKQPPHSEKEKLIYFVHEIKIPHTSTSDYYFSRPPPSHS